jgi:uncharacterized repeat protein (TIGR01451 family)
MKSHFDRLSHSRPFYLPHLVRSSATRWAIGVPLAGAIALSSCPSSVAQTAITGVTAAYQDGPASSYSTKVASPCNATDYTACNSNVTLQFGVDAGVVTTNDLVISGFSTATGGYSLMRLSDQIAFRRVDGGGGTGNKQLIFFERGNSNTNLRSSYVNTMEEAMLSTVINRGIDNAFSNDGGNASNNIERIDYLIKSGLSLPAAALSSVGFLILERGGNDNFQIAAIKSLDAAGKPASFGPLKNVTNWGSSGFNISTAVMRREDNPPTLTEPAFRPSHVVGSQTISGVYVSATDLGVVAGDIIYGYALFAGDVPLTTPSANLVSLAGAAFPLTTSGSSGSGGLDLIAGGGIYKLNTLYEISGTLYEDKNAGNTLDPTEPRLPANITVKLISATNTVLATALTGADGSYSFSGVAPGNYTVQVDTADTDIPSTLSLSTPNNLPIAITTASITGKNFGFITPTVSVSGTVFNDTNGSKTKDGMEAFVNGTTLGLNAVLVNVSTNQVVVVSTVSATGTYTFPTVPAGSYKVLLTTNTPTGTIPPAIALPTNWSTTGENLLGTPDATADSILAITVGATNVTGLNFGIAPTVVAALPPELILLKRITKINGLTTGKKADGTSIDFTALVPQPDNPATPRDESGDATNPNWIANYPKGAIDGGVIKSGDRVEYTIYFLSAGGKPVTNANFCDWVPKNTSFVPDSYGVGQGIQLAIGSVLKTFTNVPDGDRGVFYNAGAIPPTTYPNGTTIKLNCASPSGTDGAVVVNLVNNALTAPDNQLPNATAAGTPGNSYGLVRFVSQVK